MIRTRFLISYIVLKMELNVKKKIWSFPLYSLDMGR